MVHRQLSGFAVRGGGRLGLRLLVAVGLALLLIPVGGADAANRRISISDYKWSSPDIQINLGEHVTWYWIGPDTMHSVTGDSPDAAGLDSDPQTGQPNHDIGDEFKLDFNAPGVYKFRCKLHSTVRGTVTVTDTPGDPSSEPDPVPKSKVDLTPPRLRGISLNKPTFGRRGTNLKFSLPEVAKLSADMYRFDADGRRHFAGYATWPGHVGYNGVRFGDRRKHFKPRPGSYMAELTAIDKSQNVSDGKRIKFKIRKR